MNNTYFIKSDLLPLFAMQCNLNNTRVQMQPVEVDNAITSLVKHLFEIVIGPLLSGQKGCCVELHQAGHFQHCGLHLWHPFGGWVVFFLGGHQKTGLDDFVDQDACIPVPFELRCDMFENLNTLVIRIVMSVSLEMPLSAPTGS